MTDKILEVRGLTKTYGGEKRKGAKQAAPTLDVLRGIDIDIYRGDVVCLIGPSGCGKSTFLRCLNRLEIPTGGSIKFEGVEIDDSHIDAIRQKMGMVFQHFNLFPHLTVKQNLCLAPTLLKLKDKEAISAKADELLAGGKDGSIYDALLDEVKNGRVEDAQEELDRLMTAGKDKGSIKSKITEAVKEEYLAGSDRDREKLEKKLLALEDADENPLYEEKNFAQWVSAADKKAEKAKDEKNWWEGVK